MSKVVLGTAEGKAVHLDLDVLLTTRLLVTADSGGGKTVLLKRLCEQIFGKIPIHIIDPEGEFSPLREKFGFVLVGQGGETPADPRSAALVAQTLLKERASVVCDIYEMKPAMRHEFVRAYCDALIDAPKNLWSPTIVIVDEAHMFCPEGKAGESLATDSVKALSTRGRKRGICPIYATQRLAEFNKGASSMCLNRLVGGSFEDVNVKRALEVLSVDGDEKAAVKKELKLLAPGYFYALGRAISKERILVHVGTIVTPHGQTAQKYASVPPPAPAAIAKLLPKLSDLPKEAEEKARTEKEYKTEIVRLKGELKKAATAVPQTLAPKAPQQNQKQLEREITKRVAAALDGSMEAIRARDRFITLLQKHHGHLEKFFCELKKLESPKKFAPPNLNALADKKVSYLEAMTAPLSPPAPAVRIVVDGGPTVAHNGHVSGAKRRILEALAQIRGIGMDVADKAQVAAWAGYSVKSGGYANLLSTLVTAGLVKYPKPGFISATEEGIAASGEVEFMDAARLKSVLAKIRSGSEQKVLKAITDCGQGFVIDRALVAEVCGYSPTSGGFANLMSSLATKELISRPEPGKVVAADFLFID